MFGTPNYMAPEQLHEYDDVIEEGDDVPYLLPEDTLFQDGLEPFAETCENCGHVHLPGNPRWVAVAEGACAPEREENDDAVV